MGECCAGVIAFKNSHSIKFRLASGFVAVIHNIDVGTGVASPTSLKNTLEIV